MKKTILTSIAAIAFAMPAVCENIPNAATCDSCVLGVSSGSANLEADYTANTINITWDDNGATTAHSGGASSCTYDSTFNLPTAPSRTGYTFAGWAVQAAQCSLSGLDASVKGIDYAVYNLDNTCYYAFSSPETGERWTESDCSNAVFSGLNAGEWKVTFSYGSIKGAAKCTATDGKYAVAGNPDATTSGEAKYCWCQASTYTPNGGAACNVAPPSWVVGGSLSSASLCAANCVDYCGVNAMVNSMLRRGLFGSVAQ